MRNWRAFALAGLVGTCHAYEYSPLTMQDGCQGTDSTSLSSHAGFTLTQCEDLCDVTSTCDSVGFHAASGNCILHADFYCDTADGWLYYKQDLIGGDALEDIGAFCSCYDLKLMFFADPLVSTVGHPPHSRRYRGVVLQPPGRPSCL
jgi:hypothetical protein